MKKNDLIRSDKPHAVQMSEGASVAQRKTSTKKSPVSAEPASPEAVQSAVPVKAARTKPSASPKDPEKDQTAAHRPSRRQAKTAPKPAARKPRKSPPKTAPVSDEPTVAVLPIVPLWEKDSPVKARIQELQALNAQLSEQLQRLPNSRPARGSMP